MRLEQPPYSAAFLDELISLSALVFGRMDPDYIRWRMTSMAALSAFTFRDAHRLIGFKIGYAVTRSRYYSWLGGIHPDYRRQGLAADLMIRQHAWARDQGYREIETAADSANGAMAALNLQHGFTISGMKVEPGRTQTLFLKDLQG